MGFKITLLTHSPSHTFLYYYLLQGEDVIVHIGRLRPCNSSEIFKITINKKQDLQGP